MVTRIAAPGAPLPAEDPADLEQPPEDPQDTDTDAAAFDRLAEQARNVDAGQRLDARPPDPAAVDAGQLAAAVAEATEAVHMLASIALPVLAWKFGAWIHAAYGRAELDKIGQALGAVAHKRGWSLGNLMAGYGPEMALCAALLGPVLPMLIQAAKESREGPPAAAVAPDPGQAVELPAL